MFDLKMQDDLHNLLPRLVVFKLCAGVEPQGNIPVAQGTLAHIAAEENYKFIVSCGTCNFWQNPCSILVEPCGSTEPWLRTTDLDAIGTQHIMGFQIYKDVGTHLM